MSLLSVEQAPAGRSRRPLTAEFARSTDLRALIALALLTALALVLRVYDIHQGFSRDEATTVWLLRQPLGRMLHFTPLKEYSPPLYYLAGWVWGRVFGFGAADLRSLSVACGVLLVPVAYAIAHQVTGRHRAGVIAAALTSTSALMIWYSQEVRPYQMLVLFTAVGLLGFVGAVRTPSVRWLAVWVLGSAAAFAVHYFALLMTVPEAAVLLYVHRRLLRVWVASAVVGAGMLAFLPTLLGEEHALGAPTYITKTSLLYRLGQVPTQFLVGQGSPLHAAMKWIAIACVVIAVGAALRAPSRPQFAKARLVFGVGCAGLILSLALVAAGHDLLLTRNIMILWIPGMIVLAAALSAMRRRWLAVTLTAIICLIGVTATVGIARNYQYERPDWPAALKLVAHWPVRGERGRLLIALKKNRGVLQVSPLYPYYPRAEMDPKLPDRRIRVVDVIYVGPSADARHGCWWGAVCNLGTTRQRSYLMPHFNLMSVKRVDNFTVVEFRASRPRDVRRWQLAQVVDQPGTGDVDTLVVR